MYSPKTTVWPIETRSGNQSISAGQEVKGKSNPTMSNVSGMGERELRTSDVNGKLRGVCDRGT